MTFATAIWQGYRALSNGGGSRGEQVGFRTTAYNQLGLSITNSGTGEGEAVSRTIAPLYAQPAHADVRLGLIVQKEGDLPEAVRQFSHAYALEHSDLQGLLLAQALRQQDAWTRPTRLPVVWRALRKILRPRRKRRVASLREIGARNAHFSASLLQVISSCAIFLRSLLTQALQRRKYVPRPYGRDFRTGSGTGCSLPFGRCVTWQPGPKEHL